jgi:hypothetical protein
MKKEVRQFHEKKLYKLGMGGDGTQYYLESPSWDCGWYWGFGYIQGFDGKISDRRHVSHEHADKFMSEWFTQFNGSKPRLTETTFTEKEGWELSELFKRFYTLKDSAEMFGHGGCHISGTSGYLKDETLSKRINEKLIPKVTARIIEILTPTV